MWNKWGAGSGLLSKKRGALVVCGSFHAGGARSGTVILLPGVQLWASIMQTPDSLLLPFSQPPLFTGDFSTLTCPTGTHTCSRSTHRDGAALSRPHCPPFVSFSLPTPDGRSGS